MPRVKRARAAAAPPEQLLRRLRVALLRAGTIEVDGRDERVLLIDLGLRGVFVERADPLPIDADVALRFTLPGNRHEIQARGRVAWRHSSAAPRSGRLPEGLGIEFTAIAPRDQERVRTFLVEHWRRAPRARQFTREWPEDGA